MPRDPRSRARHPERPLLPSNDPFPIATLRGLAAHVVEWRDSELDVSYSVMDFLDMDRTPLTESQFTDDHIQAAMAALEVIGSQAQVIIRLGAHRQELCRFFDTHHHRFLEWLQFLCNRGTAILPAAEFMLVMLEVDGGLRQILMDSPTVIDLALNMWTQQDESGQHYLPKQGSNRCPILSLLVRLTMNPLGCSKLHDRVQARPTGISGIAETMELRVCALQQLLLENTVPTLFALRHLRGLFGIMNCLLFEPNNSFHFSLSHDLLSHISEALKVALLSETSVSVWAQVPDLLVSIYNFIFKPKTSPGSTQTRIVAALRGGLSRYLLQALLYVPESFPNYSFAADFLRDITAYIVYKKVATCLVASVEIEDYTIMSGVQTPSQVLEDCWNEVLYMVQACDASDGRSIADQMCQFTQHHDANRPGEQGRNSRRCAGCQSVAYCSTVCQRADWAIHRQECDTLCHLKASYTTLEVDLSLRAQADLAAVVQRMCNAHLGTFEQHAHERNTPLHSLILNIDCIAAPYYGCLQTTISFFDSIKNSFDNNVPQQRRIDDYLSQMVVVTQIHISYAIFPMGLSTLHVLVRMWRDPGNSFRVVSFIVIGIRQVVY